MENTINKKSYLLLNSPNIFRSIILLALPIMFSNILKSIHDIVDMWFVGRINESKEVVESMVSAITVTTPIIMIFNALAMGLMIAGAALMSQYLGSKKPEKASKVSCQLFLLMLFIGICFNLLLFFLTEPILNLMGATDKPLVFKYAKEYVQIRSFELTGLFIFFSYQATRQSMGDTVSPVILNASSIIINIILTGILVNKFHLAGAAIATVIANMIIIPVCLFLFFKTKNNEMKFNKNNLKIDFKTIKRLFLLGFPAALSQAFTSLGFLIINSMILSFDSFIVNGIGVGNRINSILLFPAMSVGTVLATFVGQNIGARNIKRAKQCVRAALIISLCITICGSSILMLFREPLSRFFNPKSEEAIEACVKYLYFLLVGLPLMGVFQIFVGTFQGAGRTDFSLILSSVRLWVLRIPIIMIYMHVFKIKEASVWYAMVISNFGATILGSILYSFVDFLPRTSKMKQKIKALEGE